MSMTIDNLRVDHRVTVLRDFTDASDITMRAGESGVLRGLSMDQLRTEIHIEIERASGKVDLVFPLWAQTGPRNGHMLEYFEVGEDVTAPRVIPAFHDHSQRQMIVPLPETKPAQQSDSAWARAAQSTEGPDRLEAMEEEMRQAFPHIGVAGSIAEMYAQRMRAFQRAGNEPRAIAAFKLAVDWMGTYASWATSGGEGAALSLERDDFRAALAREFGYDPTENNP
ncbi:MAG: hypothetical protein EXS35_17350 [Pedosphaera sp.]|nr:hypothetical protein [Pedosphaera sp.]